MYNEIIGKIDKNDYSEKKNILQIKVGILNKIVNQYWKSQNFEEIVDFQEKIFEIEGKYLLDTKSEEFKSSI